MTHLRNHGRAARLGGGSFALALVAIGAMVAVSAQPPLDDTIDLSLPGPASTRVAVSIELQDAPAAVVYAAVLERAGARDAATLAAAAAAGRAQIPTIDAAQAQLAAALAGPGFNATEIYRVRRAMNAIAAVVDAASLDALRRLPGVKTVRPLELEFPTNSSGVPFIGAPAVWNGVPGTTGAGVTIGVIDTGVDYQHATFGGSGLLADYQANDRTVTDAYYPSAKVAGGHDFVGDAYTGSNFAAPDPDPMDCNGHGTHVAGTAAGFGVTSGGATFTGPFGPSTPFSSLRIGPGSAPGATIYALRVFGCTGGTNVTIQAIDWAMDPNNDLDLSDHLDVINMSLGSSYGSLSSATALAADNAARAGVIVVTSAGNSGDTYFIGGSPGSGNRVISTAASADAGTPGAGLRVNAPAGVAGDYVAATASFGPPPPPGGVTGNVVFALDASDGAGPLTTDGCSPLTNAGAVAGNIAFVDRGTCGFSDKTVNAQNAGAIGVIIANSSGGAFGNIGGADPGTLTIPTIMITFGDGQTLRAQIGSLNASLYNGADTMASFSSRGPRLGPDGFQLKPDLAAPGVNITSAQTGVTCTSGACQRPDASGFVPGSEPLQLNGTSMAAPHVAGVMALLRQRHPAWTVEELKAVVMNTALHDVHVFPNASGERYGPGRAGAGRVDAQLAADASVVAFNADGDGLVAVSFDGNVHVGATRTKRIRLVNHGATAQTYDLSIDTVVDAPGVAYSLPGGGSVTVPAGQSVEIDVTMTATANQMQHTRDASVAPTQTSPAPLTTFGSPSRHWLTEEAGYVELRQSGTLRGRVPVYAVPMPQSSMSAPDAIVTGGAPTGSTVIPLSGTDLCTGALGAGPTCTGAFPTDVQSLVTPFELQAVSPVDPAIPPAADIQYAGVAYYPTTDVLMFGVSTWGDRSTPTQVAVNIYVDTDSNGTWDRIMFNTDPGTTAASLFAQQTSGQDMFFTAILTPPVSVNIGTNNRYLNFLPASSVDSRVFNNQVAFLSATRASLGVTGAFRWKVLTCPGFQPLCQQQQGYHYDEAAGPYSWNHAAQGLDFGGTMLAPDLNGASLPVTWNTANMAANGSSAALLLHHHNRPGERAEVVMMPGASYSDLGLTLTPSPASPGAGDLVTLTAVATNNGPSASGPGVVVSFELPDSLTYDSDDGGGSYSDATRQWTVGALAPGASQTLHLVVRTAAAGAVTARGVIGGAALDPTPANNLAAVSLTTTGQADLEITAAPVTTPILAGGSAGYTLQLTNQGAETAYNVVVTSTLTAGVGAITGGTPTSGLFDLATRQWRLASLGSGGAATLTLAASATSGPALTVQAVAASSVGDPIASNNTANASVTVTPRPTQTTLGLSPGTLEVADNSQATVVVLDVNGAGSGNPTGQVNFTSSVPGDPFTSTSCTLAPVPLSSVASTCQVTVTPGAASARQITATYVGTPVHATSGDSETLTANARPTTMTLNLAPGSGFTDQPRVATVTVIESAGGSSINPTGQVAFSSSVADDQLTGAVCNLTPVAATVDRSACQLAVTPRTAGTRQITASYAGSAAHVASESMQDLGAIERPTTLTVADATAYANDTAQNVVLSATVTSSQTVQEGSVTFTVRDSLGALVGVPVSSPPVAGGAATATYVLPGGVQPQTLTISGAYSGGNRFEDSTDTATLAVSQPPFTYLLAEGATGPFLDTDLLLANPNATPAPVQIRFLTDAGATVTQTLTLPATSQTTIRVDEITGLDAASFSTVVASTSLVPLVVERTMRWDASGYGADTEKATEGPASTWYFAEGSQGYFHTYFLLANPHNASNVAHVTFLLDGGGTVVRDYPMAPLSRLTIDAGGDADLVERSFGATVLFDRPGMAERAMYFDTTDPFAGGSAAAGVTAPSTSWRFAEGATGAFFNTFLLLANPGHAPATVTVTYLLDGGGAVTRTHPLPGRERLTINAALQDPQLAAASFAIDVASTQPVVVERSMYWPVGGWYESHTSAALTAPALRWGMAEGRVGGPQHAQTYILVGNAGTEPAELTVTFLRNDGSTVVRTFTAAPQSRLSIGVAGPGSHVPELDNESFATIVQSTQPVVVERSLYLDANGQLWAAGANATASRLP